jgi:hypothetical protein
MCVYLWNGVCLFIGECFLLYVRCVTLLEADCVVEDPNSFEENLHDFCDQGKWILPLHFLLIPYNAFNKVYFLDICIIWWVCLNRIT